MSVSKIIAKDFQDLLPLENRKRRQTCLGKAVLWIRNAEQGSLCLRVCLFFLKFAAIFLMFASLAGIPLFLALRRERIFQETEEKYLPLLNRDQKTDPLEKEFADLNSKSLLLRQKNAILQQKLPSLYKEARNQEGRRNSISPHLKEELTEKKRLEAALKSLAPKQVNAEEKYQNAQKEFSKEEGQQEHILDDLHKKRSELARAKGKLKALEKELATLVFRKDFVHPNFDNTVNEKQERINCLEFNIEIMNQKTQDFERARLARLKAIFDLIPDDNKH